MSSDSRSTADDWITRMVRFPPSLYEVLRLRAEAEHRSIQGQIISELERAVEIEKKEAV